MEILYSLFAVFFAVFLSICAWKILNWVWFTPKKLEKCLRQQGFSGNSYRLFVGDTKEISMTIKEAKSKPMNFSNDIAPRIIPSISKTIEKYGKNSFSWFGPKPAVLIMDPEHIREILSKSYIFQKPESTPLEKMVAQGLVSYEKEKWAKHRRIINPAFHKEKLKHMIPVFSMSCHEMLSKWEKIVSTKESCELDVWPYLQTLTSDVIARTAFGSNYEEGRKIFELQREQAELIMQIEWLIYIPGWRFLASKRIKRILETAREVNSAIFDIVDRRMKAIKPGEAGNDDLLGVLLESNDKEIHLHGTRSVGMSIEEVIEECKLFHFAGQETTSVLFVWTMILLSKHLDWQERAREEVLKIFGSKTPEYDELHHLKTLTMMLYELLRLYPPAFMLTRVTSNETKLGKMSLPAGVQLLIPMILLHHDKEIWGNDAKVFNPDRFREGIPKATKGQFAFFPFGWGPRICIGQNFAMLEAKIALAIILQRFTFELSPSYTHAPYAAITLQPQYGAQLVLRKV